MSTDQPAAAPGRPVAADDIDEAALTRVLQEAPRGAVALAGAAVVLLIIGYVLIYLLVFMPRGIVG